MVAYAVSDDGITFTKPTLGIHDYRPRREPWTEDIEDTNIVLTGSGGYSDRYCNSVLADQREADPASTSESAAFRRNQQRCREDA